MTELRLEVLHVPHCANLEPMLKRLGEVTHTPVIAREVRTDTEAAALGMAGSPTLLINGADPFGDPGGRAAGMSCRLYRDEQGRMVAAPSTAQLREALSAAETSPAKVR